MYRRSPVVALVLLLSSLGPPAIAAEPDPSASVKRLMTAYLARDARAFVLATAETGRQIRAIQDANPAVLQDALIAQHLDQRAARVVAQDFGEFRALAILADGATWRVTESRLADGARNQINHRVFVTVENPILEKARLLPPQGKEPYLLVRSAILEFVVDPESQLVIDCEIVPAGTVGWPLSRPRVLLASFRAGSAVDGKSSTISYTIAGGTAPYTTSTTCAGAFPGDDGTIEDRVRAAMSRPRGPFACEPRMSTGTRGAWVRPCEWLASEPVACNVIVKDSKGAQGSASFVISRRTTGKSGPDCWFDPAARDWLGADWNEDCDTSGQLAE